MESDARAAYSGGLHAAVLLFHHCVRVGRFESDTGLATAPFHFNVSFILLMRFFSYSKLEQVQFRPPKDVPDKPP